MRSARGIRIAAALSLAAGVAPAAAANGDTWQPAVVSADPVDWTPQVLDGTVRAIVRVGDAIVVGGDFHRITEAGTGRTRQQPYLFAFDAYSGALLPFRPRLDGPVYALAPGDRDTVYVGGAFNQERGAPRRGLVQLRLATGRPVNTFWATIDAGDVRALARRGPDLYVGGAFGAIGGRVQPALARLAARTGKADGAFRLRFSAQELNRVKIEALAVSPTGDRLVAAGAVTRVDGQIRAQLVMINIGVRPATLAPWLTDVYAPACRHGFDTYLRGVDFSPDGRYFVVVSTGRLAGEQRMCDTAARFETAGTGAQLPTWVNHTGGDSLYAVSVTGAAVYVGGHQRWMNNARGNEAAGPGAVPRPGIAALDPRTGAALPWNPGRSRGVGVRALVATDDGLYVGSDTDRLGGEYHARVGMFPMLG